MGNASSLRHHVETAEKTGVIQLSKSNLREIPKDLQQISNSLRTLDLNHNRLEQVTDSISLFKNLKVLNLSHNKLRFISASISHLSKLETLLVEDNMLEALPNEISRLSSLKVLNLSKNKFKNIPSQVCSMKNIELIELSYNEINDVPDDIGQSNANEINLNNNKLTRLNDALSICPKLKILRLDNNQLQVTALTRPILADSKICLLSTENNLFTLKELHGRDGYDEYGERYTSTKRKMF